MTIRNHREMWQFYRLYGSFGYVPYVSLAAAILFAATTITCLSAAEPECQRYSASQPHMGVEFEVIVYAKSAEQAHQVQAAAFARIAELDLIFSDYNPQSESRRWAEAAPHATATMLSTDFARLLRACQELHRLSDGAFDISIGSLTKLWRRARRQEELPTDDAVQTARKLTGMQHIELDPRSNAGRCLLEELRLDFGGIAKGYAAEEALQVIRKQGLTQALVRGSGDIALGDPPPNSAGWKVGIAPLDANAEPTEFVTLANVCISTSGDARQRLIVNGKRYSHIIDPRTGWPVEGRSSVTVIAPRGYLADGLATAVSVLGPEKGLKLLNQVPAVKGLVIVEQNNQTKRHSSQHWRDENRP